MKQPFQIPKRLWPTKKIEVTKKPIKQILFSISMPKNVLFTHLLKCQILGLGSHVFVSEMVVSKMLVYFMFRVLLNSPIYVREADLEP